MGFERMRYSPEEGLLNHTAFPTKPSTEDDARGQIQRMLDQVTDQVNALMAALENEDSGDSGAENIGSKSIAGISDENGAITNLWKQVEWLYNTMSDIGSGSIVSTMLTDGAVTTDKLADNAVTANKLDDGLLASIALEDNEVVTSKINNLAVTTEKLADSAVVKEKIASGAITDSKLALGAVTKDKISDLNVTETKLAASSVSEVKLKSDAVTESKIKDYSISTNKIESGAVTPAKLGVISTITLDDHDTTDKKDRLYYNPDSDQLKLLVDGCTAGVQLCPILYGTSATPPSGTYPRGTIYVQYEA